MCLLYTSMNLSTGIVMGTEVSFVSPGHSFRRHAKSNLFSCGIYNLLDSSPAGKGEWKLQAYSQDLRERVARARARGLSYRDCSPVRSESGLGVPGAGAALKDRRG